MPIGGGGALDKTDSQQLLTLGDTLKFKKKKKKLGLAIKDSGAGRDWGQEEKGTTEDEMAGWHH